jgi:hypothetical protein
MVDEN